MTNSTNSSTLPEESDSSTLPEESDWVPTISHMPRPPAPAGTEKNHKSYIS